MLNFVIARGQPLAAGFDKVAKNRTEDRLKNADRDVIALGIAMAAILLFIATGGSVMPRVVDAMLGNGKGPDQLLVCVMLLNIALIIFGWRRYRELTEEISQRKRAEAQARELAEIDPLTGCLNRRSMAAATERLRSETKQSGEAIAFAMVDLDNFKQINDMHGHGTGDQVLVAFVGALSAQLPQRSLLARLGGDEFAFVVPYDPKAPERVDDLVIRLFQSIMPSFAVGAMTLEITMSIGVASDAEEDSTADKLTAADLMHRADIAMYHAKKEGKNRFFWFEPTMESELRFRHELETGIRRGLVNKEFVPFYEQQIDLQTGKLAGFEMLARWRSPQLGIVSPEIFIPIAEEIGVIGDISDQLISQAFVHAREWDERLTLSINVSPVQLRDPWFAQKLLKKLIEHQMPPHRLEVEITESCLHDNVAMVHSMITSLRNQGIKICLDDFGTGYSSLEQLRTLPFDRLKIDRSFVSELRDAGSHSTIIDAVVTLGRGLNLPITAEGIEDEQTEAALRRMGEFKGQGYLYGRPEPVEDVRKRLAHEGLLVLASLMPATADQSADPSDEVQISAAHG